MSPDRTFTTANITIQRARSGAPLIVTVRRQREGKRRLPGQKESVAAGRVKLCWDA